VPSLAGKTLEEAEKIAARKNLKLEVSKEVFDPKVDAGLVIDQSPETGKKLPAGGLIAVRLSKGEQLVALPDLTNTFLDQATSKLDQLGLKVGTMRRDFNDTIAEDYVIFHEPVPGAKISKGTPVNLIISKGPQPLKTPDVTGKTETEARVILSGQGLVLEKREEYNDDVAAGYVIKQSPGDGVPIHRGETVTLTVSKGPLLINVPPVKGLGEEAAKSKLEEAGFLVQVRDGISDRDAYGKVVNQNPEPETAIRKGSTVTIWIGKKPSD
jgi:eukaryotic-like serine/threonine-protein kinase